MREFKIVLDNDFPEDEEEKEPLYCSFCKNKILNEDFYYDRITYEVYCNKECYISKVAKEYF